MRLYRGKIPVIAHDLLQVLTKPGELAIEVTEANKPEVRKDITSVLEEYLRTEREIDEEARDLLAVRGQSYSNFGRTKRRIARKRRFGLGEDGIDWMIKQIIEILLYSAHVEEVWVEDRELRRRMRGPLRRHMDVEEELDRAVRNRIKNLAEGSNDWDIQYQKEMEKLRRIKGLED